MPTLTNVAGWLLAPLMLGAMIAVTGPMNLMGDFRAFYCAGAVIAQRENPYLDEPLHSCELRVLPPARASVLPFVTMPAPLPPFVLVAFVPLSWFPFPIAAAVFGVLLIAAMSAAVALFARVTQVSSVLLNLAFAGITATQTYFLGQPLPFVFLALAAAAVFVRGGRWLPASACAVVAAAEPHLALPVLLAMLVAFPPCRLPIAACCLLASLLSAIAVGVPATIAYVSAVLPAHALANAYEWQFSLTSILTSFGVGAPSAVGWGEAMYAAMLILGVAVALRMLRATGDRAAIILLPPAFAVFGGVHVHFQQLAVAFPALLFVYARFPRLRSLTATAVTFTMIPWNVLSASVMTGFTPLLVGWFARTTMNARRGLILTTIAALIALSVLALALAGFGPGNTDFVARAYPPGALAESSWGGFSRAVLARPSLLLQWLRIPVLAGLALGLYAIAKAAFGDSACESKATVAAPDLHYAVGTRSYAGADSA
jgi:hypothetical protein